jgi:ribonucleoside-diphosphate reductase alpha chain
VKLAWLEGLCDADGTVKIAKNGAKAIQINSINKEFLLNVQMMLETLGTASKISIAHKPEFRYMPDGNGSKKEYFCQECYVLYITCYAVEKLQSIGFNPKRLDLSENKPIQRKCGKHVRVVSIVDEERYDKTFCFNEPKRHFGVFNGILTGQSETYSMLIDTYIKQPSEKDQLLHAVK